MKIGVADLGRRVRRHRHWAECALATGARRLLERGERIGLALAFGGNVLERRAGDLLVDRMAGRFQVRSATVLN